MSSYAGEEIVYIIITQYEDLEQILFVEWYSLALDIKKGLVDIYKGRKKGQSRILAFTGSTSYMKKITKVHISVIYKIIIDENKWVYPGDLVDQKTSFHYDYSSYTKMCMYLGYLGLLEINDDYCFRVKPHVIQLLDDITNPDGFLKI